MNQLNKTMRPPPPPPIPDENLICYAPSMITTNGIWQAQLPLEFSLPTFILQLMLIVVTTRALIYILRPLRQPRVVAEIMGGLLLGPSGIGAIPEKHIASIALAIFPSRSVMVLETMANVGLLYFLFLAGVELDLTMVKRTGPMALIIAITAIGLPSIVAVSTAYLLKAHGSEFNDNRFLFFIAIAISVAAFPVLARILAELKLTNTELGRVSMSAAVIIDISTWILLAIAITAARPYDKSTDTSEYVTNISLIILKAVGFVAGCIVMLRPAITWIVKRTPEGESFNDFYICLILAGVMISGFITDIIGLHSIFGAFVIGLIIPNGPLSTALLEKLEDFITALLLPLIFATGGLSTNLFLVGTGGECGWTLLLVVLPACFTKVVGTLLITLLHDMSFREGISMGLFLNTGGLMEFIVLNAGVKFQVIKKGSYAVMVIVTLVMTGITAPTVAAIYKPTRRYITYKNRTIQRAKPDTELRILVCVHTPRNVPTIINLLDASHASKKSPICIYALHLVELTGRASAVLTVHNARKSGHPAINRTQAQSEHIVNAFKNYVQHTGNVVVQALTAVSPYSTMHEDICNLAEDKRVTIIIVPFHKQQTVDGGMEATHPAFRGINQNVLANAPCSVGILIDRGLTGPTLTSTENVSHNFVVLFFGGPDDREALAYAWRMADHPGVSITVIRFIPGDVTAKPKVEPQSEKLLSVITDNEREKHLDDEYISVFRLKAQGSETITYNEKVVNNGEETVSAIRSLDNIHDLIIVGRGRGVVSPLTAGLTDWSECPELGAIGDLLGSSDFAASMSVLVVQQYVGEGMPGHAGGVGTPDSPADES